MVKRISILGSTGSIGTSTLKVIESFPERFKVVGLTANKNSALLVKQIERFRPQAVALADKHASDVLRSELKTMKLRVKVYSGLEGLINVATLSDADMVVSAIVGSAGLIPTLEAIRHKKDIALANKEVLVMAGKLVMDQARRMRVNILPVDSEHNAIFQCLGGESIDRVHSFILTASGGPFYNKKASLLKQVTVKQTVLHPVWKMGAKISVDSATMMNKGFEILEAQHLFNIDIEKVRVLIHPETIVHSFVEFIDGSLLAQLGIADMRLPIQYALFYPERSPNHIPRLSFDSMRKLTFLEPDFKKFPCLKFAYEAGRIGGTMPAVLNAADEIAVDAFLAEEISFTQIPLVIRKVMESHIPVIDPYMEDILKADADARSLAKELVS